MRRDTPALRKFAMVMAADRAPMETINATMTLMAPREVRASIVSRTSTRSVVEHPDPLKVMV